MLNLIVSREPKGLPTSVLDCFITNVLKIIKKTALFTWMLF